MGTSHTYLLSSPNFHCLLAWLILSHLADRDSFLPFSLKSLIHQAAMATHPKGRSDHLHPWLKFNGSPARAYL